MRVSVYYATDKDRAFEEALQEALRIDPYEPFYYYLQANMLNKKGRPSQAKTALSHALELRPESPLYLAVEYKLKETYIRNAVRLDPEDKQYQDEFLEALQHRNVI
ncbi:hypothetical protein [Paenibacillus lautus]|uniref:hypothetical protein n=1 Tax=Paenibacillus lautus TaxID=1401 RepID=UPI001C7CF96A|nr:hypothetical protein [Paenibacillus lautus]MBX4148382.1 hypothetical protein [Paenibacillus lautus]